VYRVFFAPLDLRRKLEDVGYIHHDSSLTKEESVWDTQRRKKIGNAPPVFPNGWFKVANSNWIKKGQVKSIYLFGEHIALFRNKRGLLRALNAYCPHLGANMAAGGKVVNSDCLECPFHGWKFSGETGKLVDVPYAQKVPTFVSVKKWSCCEVDDMAYMWYHCDGGEPKWKIPSAETIHSLKYVGKTEHIINCHIQIGPGAVHIHVRTPFFRGLMLQNVTPIEPFMQKLTHTFYCSTWVPVCIAKAFYLLETTQIERDILMWNNKTYFRKPILVKEESALAKHRRWYQQFYSENSPKVNQRGELVTP
uniref:cholesterol 7-desaturase n=1 Tax=Ciona savignyi TaxID=51511 RepID=H2ZBT4_CIOSA